MASRPPLKRKIARSNRASRAMKWLRKLWRRNRRRHVVGTWRWGTVQEFLGLTDEEVVEVEKRLDG